MAPFAFFSHPFLANGIHDPGFFLIIVKIIKIIYILINNFVTRKKKNLKFFHFFFELGEFFKNYFDLKNETLMNILIQKLKH
jgi:hypothetical protein